ncbi:putative aldouronate transport system permease protein [Paenibacillus lactis]|uniref:Binding-protein-dependent transport systems inner membrane component n=3 Tax=Paenibacillus TaxID=44249 RepID=G4HC81_9BACL|nr:binding-protein-dependent transport systems inner membrane component [Paenibacillus lactis 154]MBP1893734.1 putative aldouronate transport system permease protein [Paenibacillus lactis]
MPGNTPIAASKPPKRTSMSRSRLSQFRKYKVLYIISLPGLLYFIVFKYIPLLGSAMAFQDYNIFNGFSASPWVGLEHFRRMFEYSEFLRILKNTILIGGYDLIFAFPVPIILAILLNEMRVVLFKRVLQTVVYMPHFLSWVIIGGIAIGILSPSTGLVNSMLESLGLDSIYFLGEESYIRSILVGSGIWKDSGWGTIVYLAALAGINPELYEAARIDGANRWKQISKITIPAILPTVVIMFLLHIGNFLDFGFERVFVFLNPLNENSGDILDTYIYRVGLIQQQYSYTTAIGLFKSVVGLGLIMIGNTLSKKATGSGLY